MSETTCPTCGKPLDDEPDRLAAALARSGPNAVKGDTRSVYKTREGRWALTHGHFHDEPQFWNWQSVSELVRHGRLIPTYPECQESFTLPR